MSAAPQAIARPAPDATTMVLLRPSGTGGAPELFMVRRSGGADFFGDAYVFPGGGVDEEDADPELASRASALPPVDIERLLGEGLPREQAVACWVAGVRELFEETGVMLAYRDGRILSFVDAAVRERFARYRDDIRAHRVTLKDIVARESLTLALDCVHYFSRFVTPPYARKRYDTRFVLAAAPPDQLASYDPIELTQGDWLTTARAVALYHSRKQQIVPPTLQNLLELQRCASIDEMIDIARTRTIAPICPITIKNGADFTLIYPGDRDFMHQLEPPFKSIYKQPAGCPVLRFKLEKGGRWAIAPGITKDASEGTDMSKSIEQRVQELADREEIKELTARYCWHVAHGEGEQVANLFADDGLLEVRDGTFKPVRGKDDLLKFYRTSVREPELAVPFIHNHIIEISGDDARGTCTIDARFIRNNESVMAAGFYNDTYRRVNGKWRFVERRITFHHVAPLKVGWAEMRDTQRKL
jgi:8-oxo-dGTP pyrophosphatase MutT (NUDIX family)